MRSFSRAFIKFFNNSIYALLQDHPSPRQRQDKRRIRMYPDAPADWVKTKVWHQVKETIGRHKVDYIEVLPKEGDDPEVVAKLLGQGGRSIAPNEFRNHPS